MIQVRICFLQTKRQQYEVNLYIEDNLLSIHAQRQKDKKQRVSTSEAVLEVGKAMSSGFSTLGNMMNNNS